MPVAILLGRNAPRECEAASIPRCGSSRERLCNLVCRGDDTICKPEPLQVLERRCNPVVEPYRQYTGGHDEQSSYGFDHCRVAARLERRLAQSTTATGAVEGARAGGAVAGPVGEIVGGTVGAAVGAAVEIPNAVITSVQRERAPSVTVRERVVVGEPLPPTVVLRTVPSHTEYRYAVVNDRRVIVEPRTRRIIRIID